MVVQGDPRPSRGIGAALARLPRWARGALAVVALLLGVVLVIRPTTSLGVLALLVGAGLILVGVLELVSREEAVDGSVRVPRWRIAMAVLWIVAGLVVLALPGLTVRLLAVIVGAGLIVNGVLSALSGLRRGLGADARIAAIALGLAGILFGVLALAWPDITLLVVAVVFGARLVVTGLLELWRAIRGTEGARRPAAPGRARRWLRTIAALSALVLAVAAGALSVSLHGASPVVDEFYAPPRDVPDEPGRLIRAEAFTRAVPEDAVGWRILYTTTRGDGSPAVASGLVIVPREGDGPWPVIDWTHGTTGYAQNCAPTLAESTVESGALFVLPQIIDQGWALVATDYIGLGSEGPHPYLVGSDSAHAALDALRAAYELDEARLSGQTVVWGHSQGGGAALWTGALAEEYAPELAIEGIAALAPASNLPGLVANTAKVTGGSVFASFVIEAYSRIYPDVTYRQYIRPGAEETVRRMATRCLAEPSLFVSILESLAMSEDPQILAQDPTTGPFGQRLVENIPPATISAPLLLGQGGSDGLVLPAAQEVFVDGLCRAGQQLDYRVYAGRDHVPLVQPDSPLIPELIAWTEDRLAGEPVDPGCVRSER